MRRLVTPRNVTITHASPAVITTVDSSGAAVAHGLLPQTPVVFSTTGTLPAGLTAGTTYYVISTGLTTTAFEVSAAPYSAGMSSDQVPVSLPADGAAVDTTTDGSGTHSMKGLDLMNMSIWTNDDGYYLITHSKDDVAFYTTLSTQWVDINSAVNAIVYAWNVPGFRDCAPQKTIPTVNNTFDWGPPNEVTTNTVTMTEMYDMSEGITELNRAMPANNARALYPRVVQLKSVTPVA